MQADTRGSCHVGRGIWSVDGASALCLTKQLALYAGEPMATPMELDSAEPATPAADQQGDGQHAEEPPEAFSSQRKRRKQRHTEL